MTVHTHSSSSENSSTPTCSPRSEGTDNDNLAMSTIFYDTHSPLSNTSHPPASVSFQHHLPTRSKTTIHSTLPCTSTTPEREKRHSIHLTALPRHDRRELADYSTKPSAKLPHYSIMHKNPTNDVPSGTLTDELSSTHHSHTNAPLPPTPISRPLHPFHRHTSITPTHDSVWQDICLRVLPLFNGQGVQGAVEDMNDLLRQCITDPHLYEHIQSLLQDGMLTLNGKLSGVTDERLLDRLVEQWSFFFTCALPYFEAVFLPLRTKVDWQVRHLALASFRDHVILPQTHRLQGK